MMSDARLVGRATHHGMRVIIGYRQSQRTTEVLVQSDYPPTV